MMVNTTYSIHDIDYKFTGYQCLSSTENAGLYKRDDVKVILGHLFYCEYVIRENRKKSYYTWRLYVPPTPGLDYDERRMVTESLWEDFTKKLKGI